jgi:hypothetical protein
VQRWANERKWKKEKSNGETISVKDNKIEGKETNMSKNENLLETNANFFEVCVSTQSNLCQHKATSIHICNNNGGTLFHKHHILFSKVCTADSESLEA